MDNLLRLRYLRHRQTPKLLKRVNAHAARRELSTSVLAVIIQFCRFSDNKNLKVDIHPICPCKLISAHRHLQFNLVRHLSYLVSCSLKNSIADFSGDNSFEITE